MTTTQVTARFGLHQTPPAYALKPFELNSSTLAEILIEDAQTHYSDATASFRAILAIGEQFRHGGGVFKDVGPKLTEYVRAHWTECLEAGVCPQCGENVTVKQSTEPHSEPLASGTATERKQEYVCGRCGEL